MEGNKEEYFSNLIVIKRDGKHTIFDKTKIAVAIKKGFDSIDSEKQNEDDVNKVFNKVLDKIYELNLTKIKIEQIQDIIEEELKSNGYEDVYNSFSEYREKRAQSREIFFEEKRKHKFLKALEKLGLSNKEKDDTKLSKDRLIEYGKTVSEEFATSYLMKKKFSEAHENGDIYIKNIEYYPMRNSSKCMLKFRKAF